MTDAEFRSRSREINRIGEDMLRKRQLKELKDSYKKPKKKLQFTKVALFLIATFIILNCTAIEIFSCYAMIKLYNLDALSSLISAVITESVTLLGAFVGYMYKSLQETKEEERIKLEREKMNLEYEFMNAEQPQQLEDGSVG